MSIDGAIICILIDSKDSNVLVIWFNLMLLVTIAVKFKTVVAIYTIIIPMSIDGAIICILIDSKDSNVLVIWFNLMLLVTIAVKFKTVVAIYTIIIPEKSSGSIASNGEIIDRALFNHKPATSESRPLFL
jgi:hypothetical protein